MSYRTSGTSGRDPDQFEFGRFHWLRESSLSRSQLPSEAPELVETRYHGKGADGPLPRDDPVSARESVGKRESALLV